MRFRRRRYGRVRFSRRRRGARRGRSVNTRRLKIGYRM